MSFLLIFAAVVSGKEIDKTIGVSMDCLITNKLPDKALGEMMDTYATPINCKAMVVPKVNSPIWDSLEMNVRSIEGPEGLKMHSTIM